MTISGKAAAPTDIKVALVAVASKEAAYIAEWVFHHLRFGFDPIVVLVNRSDDDATQKIVAQIGQFDSRVRVINVDFLDKGVPQSNKKIQPDAYGFGLDLLRKELAPDSYMVCLDIDEFWTSVDFRTIIQDYLRRNDMPPKCAFIWFLLTDEPHVFGPAFRQANTGKHGVHLKFGFQIGQPVKRIFAHRVEESNQLPVRLPSGTYLDASRSRASIPPENFGDAFIYHRLNRSVVEYVGLLGRTCLEAGELPFKVNRHGYKTRGKFDVSEQVFPIAIDRLNTYYDDLNAFLRRHDILEMIQDGRKTLLELSQTVIERFASLPPEDQETYVSF